MVKEKIGQMLLMGFKGTELNPRDPIINAIRQKQIGGVILFAANIKSPMQLVALTTALRNEAEHAGLAHFWIALDYEGGTVERLDPRLGFPATHSASELGAMSDGMVLQEAREMARTLKQAGINLNFAPTIDVNINPNNPIIGKRERSFSANAERVAECAAIFTRAYQEQGILCTYKHFPGHGSSDADSHLGFVDVTKTWQLSELEPYKRLLPAFNHQPLVMMAHVVHAGLDSEAYPASLSRSMVQGLLRDKLGFQGVVVSDDLQMKAITNHYGRDQALRLAINAGVDLLIFGNQLVAEPESAEQIINQIYEDVTLRRIPETRIDEAVARLQKAAVI
jgi:beta-N-acetylhexosaminidase